MNDLLFMSPAEREMEEHRLRIQEENGRFYWRMKTLGIDVSYMFERNPIHAETFGLHWHKTADEPPTEKDGDAVGNVLTVGYCLYKNWGGNWLETTMPFGIVADHPDRYSLWMPLPRLPDLPTPEMEAMIVL